ncbi:MAG: hypothetical protein AB1499_09345 [Nitrospirota bacterium]
MLEDVPPFRKGGQGGFEAMLPYNNKLQLLSRSFINNMTDAEKLLWSK